MQPSCFHVDGESAYFHTNHDEEDREKKRLFSPVWTGPQSNLKTFKNIKSNQIVCFENGVLLSCLQSRRLLLLMTSLCFSSFVWLIAASLTSAWTEQLQSCLYCLGHRRALCFCLCVLSSACWARHFGSPCTKRGRTCGFRSDENFVSNKGQRSNLDVLGIWTLTLSLVELSSPHVMKNLSKTKLCTVQAGGGVTTRRTRRSRTRHVTHLTATQVYLSERPTQRSRVERIKNSKQIVSSRRLKHKPPVCLTVLQKQHTHMLRNVTGCRRRRRKNQSKAKLLALSSSISSAST